MEQPEEYVVSGKYDDHCPYTKKKKYIWFNPNIIFQFLKVIFFQ